MSQTEPKTNMPLFYSKAEPLSKSRHAQLGLVRREGPFTFAAGTNAVPVNTSEFNMAQKFYPIVFTPGTPRQALAILGVKAGENLFVDESGVWSSGHYVPAYVRRYPFIFAQSPQEEDRFVLCVETESDLVSENPDMPFFENGEMTETAQKAMEFCQAFHQEAVATRPFLDALDEFGLLTEQNLSVRGADGTEQKLGSFHAVDEGKLEQLDDAQFLELRQRKILPLIYLHLASLLNWPRLLNIRAQKTAAADNENTRH